MSRLTEFLAASEEKTFDLEHRKKIKFNIGKYNASVNSGMAFYADHELARERAAYIKTNTNNNLDKYLVEWEKNFKARGGKVIWAQDKEEALKAIGAIMKRDRAKRVVKSKSMITEEIHLNDYLEANGIESLETDLGEYIVQLAGQKPYHIVTPAMHMSKQDLAKLFTEKLRTPPTDDAGQLVATARRLLRDKYTSAEVGITGANFLLADIGGIALTENEGNARLCTTFPKTHIAIVGIEKMLPSVNDLDLFWPLLSTSGTGQNLTVYNTILTGPRQPYEKDGPDDMYVILLDNGRTELLAHPEKRDALNCIRCGACLNVCPVYRNIGGHTYGTTYSGPIGSVIEPHLEGMEKNKHLSYASSLCGACTSVCPVKIPIHNLLLLNRKQSVEEGLADKQEKLAWKWYVRAMKNRKLLNLPPAALKNWALGKVLKDNWHKKRENPVVAPKSFNTLWKERRK